MWSTLCRALYSYSADNSSQLLLPSIYKRETESLRNLPKHTVSGIAGPQIQTHPWSYPPCLISSCPCCFCNQDTQTSVDSEPADKALPHFPSFSSQGQGKTEMGDMRSRQDQPCAPWPQGPECEADGTQTLIQDSCCPVLQFWHFIWTYLFILFKTQLCSQVGNQSTQTETLSGDVLSPSEGGWKGNQPSY